MCMCVCIYVYIYIYIYVFMYMYAYRTCPVQTVGRASTKLGRDLAAQCRGFGALPLPAGLLDAWVVLHRGPTGLRVEG
jgi:hypothetical protein